MFGSNSSPEGDSWALKKIQERHCYLLLLLLVKELQHDAELTALAELYATSSANTHSGRRLDEVLSAPLSLSCSTTLSVSSAFSSVCFIFNGRQCSTGERKHFYHKLKHMQLLTYQQLLRSISLRAVCGR
jgi:hypothetical protein